MLSPTLSFYMSGLSAKLMVICRFSTPFRETDSSINFTLFSLTAEKFITFKFATIMHPFLYLGTLIKNDIHIRVKKPPLFKGGI